MSYPGAVTYIEVAVFESSHFHEVGVDVRGAATRQYCCTPWVANRTNCHPNRGLIRNIDSDSSSNGTVGISFEFQPSQIHLLSYIAFSFSPFFFY